MSFLCTKIDFIMGKGDIKTKRGKITNGSYGVSRPAKKVKPAAIKVEVEKTKKKK